LPHGPFGTQFSLRPRPLPSADSWSANARPGQRFQRGRKPRCMAAIEVQTTRRGRDPAPQKLTAMPPPLLKNSATKHRHARWRSRPASSERRKARR
jgi:hypothetical protein